jgi:hypothetical protein
MSVSETVGDRLVELCERLAAATVARNVEWRSDGEDRFVWARAAGSVSIGSRDGDGDAPYQVSVSNADGVEVDRLYSQLVDGDRAAPWNAALAELYRVARRNALHADELLDTLIALLRAPDNAA